MIKKKKYVDENKAFENACQDNNIIFKPKVRKGRSVKLVSNDTFAMKDVIKAVHKIKAESKLILARKGINNNKFAENVSDNIGEVFPSNLSNIKRRQIVYSSNVKRVRQNAEKGNRKKLQKMH